MSDTFSSSGGNIQGRGPVRPYRSRAKASGRILILFDAISSSPSSEVYTLLGLLPGYSLSNLTTLQAAAGKMIWGFAGRAVLNLVWLQKLDSIDAWDRPSHRLHPRKSSPTEIFIRGTYWRSVPQMEVFTYRASSIGELVDSTPEYWKILEALNTRDTREESDWWTHLPSSVVGYDQDILVDRLHKRSLI